MSGLCLDGRCGSPRGAAAWQGWLAAVLMAVVAVTAVSATWHAGHEVDPDCAVCKLRHQPLADLADTVRVEQQFVPERIAAASDIWIPADTSSAVPARGPPLS